MSQWVLSTQIISGNLAQLSAKLPYLFSQILSTFPYVCESEAFWAIISADSYARSNRADQVSFFFLTCAALKKLLNNICFCFNSVVLTAGGFRLESFHCCRPVFLLFGRRWLLSLSCAGRFFRLVVGVGQRAAWGNYLFTSFNYTILCKFHFLLLLLKPLLLGILLCGHKLITYLLSRLAILLAIKMPLGNPQKYFVRLFFFLGHLCKLQSFLDSPEKWKGIAKFLDWPILEVKRNETKPPHKTKPSTAIKSLLCTFTVIWWLSTGGMQEVIS